MAARTDVRLIRQTLPSQDDAPVPTPDRPRPDPREEVVAAMAEMLSLAKPGSTAEALKSLRLIYPDYPLALRLAGLAAAMKRTLQDPNGIYIPR